MNEQRYTEELDPQGRGTGLQDPPDRNLCPGRVLRQRVACRTSGERISGVALKVITLDALPDRADGQIGEAQLNALQAKLARLEERYQSGISLMIFRRNFPPRRSAASGVW